MPTQYLTPIQIHAGFVFGRAAREGVTRVPVHLYVDGAHVATEYAGAKAQDPAGQATADGFCFALPSAALDGFAHDIHVALPPSATAEALYGETDTYRPSAVCGTVAQRGRQFIGTVWFKTAPSGSVTLDITDQEDTVVLQQPLTISESPDAEGYPAQFAVLCDTLPAGPLTFACAGQQLRGSPCARRVMVLGLLESAGPAGIRGWAFDASDFGQPIELCLRIDGRPAAWFRPNMRRPELEARLGQGAALIGFHLPWPDGLTDGQPHRLEVVAADDGELLEQGQCVVKVAPAGVPHLPRLRAICEGTRPRRSQQPLVSLIVLNRNGAKVLRGLLESWARHNRTVATEIIVVDHASTDDSLSLLQEWSSRLDVRVLALDRNDSFSQSCNRGARHARAENLLFMNNDIVWLQDALPAMLETLRCPETGIVGLKLHKAVGESQHAFQPATEVQHLGVRFKLNARGYWPFEVAPSRLADDPEHEPQTVPAVTGAVLLCRKSDFDAVGGFDESYFYGFEDVELCLRLSQRLGKTVVCRNDLVALHRHGHTRLSGREISLFDRVQRNSEVLARHVGLWAKQAYWRSLIQGDRYMTSEPLSIGIVVDELPRVGTGSCLGRDALELADAICASLPHARVSFLPPERGWKNAADLHVLLVGLPAYDIRALHRARADLLTVAWGRLEADAAEWRSQPWFDSFDAYLGPGSFAEMARPCDLAAPLAHILSQRHWRMRVAVHVPLPEHKLQSDDPTALRARALRSEMRQAGYPCWLVPAEQWDDHPAMADICVTVCEHGGSAPCNANDVLNVAWLCDGEMPPANWQPRHRVITNEQPTAAWLYRLMEERIGNSFRPS